MLFWSGVSFMQGQIKPGPRLPLGLVGVFFFKFSDGVGIPVFFPTTFPETGFLQFNFKVLVPVVQTLDSAIHWINRCPLDKYYGNQLRYPLDSDLSGG